MEKMNEAVKIDGFDAETQHAFDKLAGYFAVFKSRANPKSPRYITKLNEFQLKFLDLMDKAETEKARYQIGTFIKEIRGLIDAKDKEAAAEPKNTVITGGKIRDLSRKGRDKTTKPEEWTYTNPNNGGEYWDGDVHVYEAPAEEDEEVTTAVEKLRKKGYKVSK